jgi:hypothetical protein
MTPLTTFYPYFMHHVMGCSEPLADRALVDAAIEFCQRGEPIRRTVVVDIVDALTVAIPDNLDEDVIAVPTVMLGTATLAPANEMGAFSLDNNTPGTVVTHYTHAAGVLTLHPPVATTGRVTVLASFAPKRDATQIDDLFLRDWNDTLIEGVLSRLRAVPNQPFSDPAMAEVNRMRFSQGCTAASIQADRAHTTVPLRVSLSVI